MKKKLLIAVPLVVLLAVLLVYGAVYFRVKQLVDAQLQELVASGLYQTADYDQLSVSPLGNMQLGNLHLQQPDMEIIINDVTVSNVDLFHEVPWHLQVAVDGIRFPAGLPDLSGSGNPMLETLLSDLVQEDTLQLHVEYAYRYNPTQSEQLISSGKLVLPNYFELSGESETRNIPLGEFAALNAADPAAASALQAELLQKAALPRANLRLQDSGLVEVLTAIMAESSGMPAAALHDQLKSQLQNYYLFLPANFQNFGRQVGVQLAEFMDGNRSMTLTITPAFNGELAQLQPEVMGLVLTGDVDKAVELLQLEIVVE